MPNRIIKESICCSDDIDKLTAFEETVFYRMIVRADDYGRLDARPSFLKSMLFVTKQGITEKNVQDAVLKMASVGLVRLYEVDGKPFLSFPKWDLHQRVRNSKEKYPAPPENTDCGVSPQVAANCGELPRVAALIQSESNPNPNPNPKESVSRATRFTPPTVEEVAAYCLERKNHVDPQRFVDFYAAKGWMVGKNRMKDWKAAVRTWEQRDGEKWGTESKNSNIFLDMLEKEMAHE